MATYTNNSVYDPQTFIFTNYFSILMKIIAINYSTTKFVAPCPIRRWNGTAWVVLYMPVS